jgi:hypothetical protein
LQADTLCCAFGHQQTGDSTGKSVSNIFRNQNVQFCRWVNIDQRIIDHNDYETGEKRCFKGNNEMGFWE